jgi:hypothetical protein
VLFVNTFLIHVLILLEVEATPGSKGRLRVKAATLQSWYVHFVQCIIRYTRDDHGDVAGMKLLIDQGFFTKLDEEILHRELLTPRLLHHQLYTYLPLSR